MRYAKHIPVARAGKACEICEAPLRSNYRKDERVCAHPKIPGTTQSVCQQMLARKTGATSPKQDTTGKKCLTCGEVMIWVTNANQKYCKRPLYLRQYFIDPRTMCEKTAQSQSEKDWRDNNKDGRVATTPWSVQEAPKGLLKIVYTKRKCLGVLTNDDELGEHYFLSDGVGNRVCERCRQSSETRKLTFAKHSQGAAGLSFITDDVKETW